MKNIYCISGLGADKHAFDRLKFDPLQWKVHFIDWLEPHADESLSAYAFRMSSAIDTDVPVYLLGLSFGGIIAIEIAKHIHVTHIFLLSSIATRFQLPWYLHWGGRLHLHQAGFIHLIKKYPRFLHQIFGVKSPRMKAYVNDMAKRSSDTYLGWSMTQIANWKQTEKLPHLTHIHGDLDAVFPIRYIQADIVLHKGSHFAVLTHAQQISKIINAHV